MTKKKKIITIIVAVILSITVVCVSPVVLVAGGVWFFLFDTGTYARYNGEPIKEIEANESRVYFVTEDGDGYFFGGYTSSSDRKYRNNGNRNNNSLGAPYPLKFYKGKIAYIYPYATVGCLFITERGDLYMMDDTKKTKIAEDVAVASKVDQYRTCYVTVDGTLKIIDDDGTHRTLIESGVKDARVYKDNVFVILENGYLNIYTLSGEDFFRNKEALCRDIKKIDIAVSYNPDQKNDNAAILNVLAETGDMVAWGAYSLYGQDDTFAGGDSWLRHHELTPMGSNVVDFSVENSGTIMQLSDGSLQYYGFDTGLYREKAAVFGEKELDLSNVKTACVFERMVYCVDSNNLLYVWGGYGNVYFSPSFTEGSRDIFTDSPVIVDFGKKKITY